MNFKALTAAFIICFGLFLSTASKADDTSHISFTRLVQEIDYVGLDNVSPALIKKKPELLVRIGRKISKQDLLKDIQDFYLTGYFESVTAETIESEEGLQLRYIFTENPVISSIVFNGNISIKSKDLLEQLYTKPGSLLNINTLSHDRSQLEDYYHQKGYDLMAIQEIVIDSDNNLVITIYEGILGDINFLGETSLPKSILYRDLRLKPGDPFNSFYLRKDRESLLKLGYFSSVSVPRLTIDSEDLQKVDVSYTVKEKKVNLLNLGLEQEDDSVVAFVQTRFNHRLIKSDLLSTKLQIEPANNGYDIRSYSIRYAQPWILNKWPVSFTADTWTIYNNEFLTDDISKSTVFETKRIGWDVIFGFPLRKDVLNLNIQYKSENVSPETNTSLADPYTIRSLSSLISYRTIEDLSNPRSGRYLSFEIEKGGNVGFTNFGGLDFTRFVGNGAIFRSITDKGTLAFRGFSGIFLPDDTSVQTFDEEGFTLGGVNSLRGYKETSPFVGNREILLNIEYRYTVGPKFQWVYFYDMGKVFSEGYNLEPDTFKTGYGIGIRIFTPVGPIRFDFAQGESFIIHFGLGQLF